MRTLELDDVFYLNGKLVIKLKTFAKLFHYSDTYLLKLIKRLLKRGIRIGFKWRRSWYVFLPKNGSVNSIIRGDKQGGGDGGGTATLPSGAEVNIGWNEAATMNELPADFLSTLGQTIFTLVTVRDRLKIATSATLTGWGSSTLIPKNLSPFKPSNQGDFRSTKEYKYGYYIIYDETKMSSFDPGASGSLKSTQLPQAFFETCRLLDAAENLRNGSNPGLPARRNLSTTASFDTGTIAVAATIPITTVIEADGTVKVLASDYLGATYSAFNNGGGDLNSTNTIAALFEVASMLAAAEKAITPIENQPNNVQIQIDMETSSATLSANIPFTTAAANNGDVTIKAIDYL